MDKFLNQSEETREEVSTYYTQTGQSNTERMGCGAYCKVTQVMPPSRLLDVSILILDTKDINNWKLPTYSYNYSDYLPEYVKRNTSLYRPAREIEQWFEFNLSLYKVLNSIQNIRLVTVEEELDFLFLQTIQCLNLFLFNFSRQPNFILLIGCRWQLSGSNKKTLFKNDNQTLALVPLQFPAHAITIPHHTVTWLKN